MPPFPTKPSRGPQKENVERVLASKVLSHRWLLIAAENKNAKEVHRKYSRVAREIDNLLRVMWPFPRRLSESDRNPIDKWNLRSRGNAIYGSLRTLARAGYREADNWSTDYMRDALVTQTLHEHKWYSMLCLTNIPRNALDYNPFGEARLAEAGVPIEDAKWLTDAQATGFYTPMARGEAIKLTNQLIPNNAFKGMKAWKSAAIRRSVMNGLSEGWGMEEIAREIKKRTKLPTNSAMRLARTETMRCSNTVARKSYAENKNVVAGVQNFATLDRKTCIACGVLDRRTYFYEGEPTISEAPNYPIHPHCRCFQAPISRLWKRWGIEPPWTGRESEEGPVSYEFNWNSWMRDMEKQVPGWAKQSFGPKRYKAWKQGIASKHFVKNNNVLKIDQLKELDFKILKRL